MIREKRMNGKSRRTDMLSFKSMIKTLSVWILIVSVIFMCADESGHRNNEYKPIPPDGAWEIRTLENGEKYLYCSISGEMIYKAYSCDKTGNFSEIPIDEYMDFRNTAPLLPDEYEKLDRYTRCTDSFWVDYREEKISPFYGSPEICSSLLTGPGIITLSAYVPDSYSYTAREYEFAIPPELTARVVFLPQLTVTEGKRYLKPFGINIGEESECVYETDINGYKKGIYELVIERFYQ